MYPIFNHWGHCDYFVSVNTMYSQCTCWVFEPLSPVFVSTCLAEFLQTLDEHLRTLDNYEQRIKALEERVCKCAETKPWAHGSRTHMDPLKIVDDDLKYVDEPTPPLSSSSYGTPPIAQPELVNERREGIEELHVPAPLCCTQPLLHPSTQVEKAM